MKKRLNIAVTLLLLAGCSEAPHMVFDEFDRVQIGEKTVRYNFIYAKDRDAVRDTVYITVNTIGYPQEKSRRIDFRQIAEYDPEIILDEKGNIIDTLYHEVMNKAVAGVHYVPMNDPEMLPHLYIAPNTVTQEVPVILLRDASLKEDEVRLCLELVATEDFFLGEQSALSQTIYIADTYSKPSTWDEIPIYFFGEYSKTKHAWMTELLHVDVDDDYLSMLTNEYGYLTYVLDLLRLDLSEFNSDPDNLASGVAPMKDENGKLITIPG